MLALALFGPQSAMAWWNGDWSYRKQITIDTTPKGVGLSADAGRMPMLIRLHDGNFKFEDAKDDGSDLRFVDGDDKTPLRFHIESYDGNFGMALVWVDIPAVKAGGTTQIWMYYGNPNAPVGGDAHGTYDSDTTLVYHFAERGAPAHDSTANNNNALSPAKTINNSIIGIGAHFDGANVVGLPASRSLAVAPNGPLTWSAWIKPDGSDGILYAQRDAGNAIIIGLDQGKPYVSIVSDGAELKAIAPAAIPTAGWHHVAVTASAQTILYVDGKQVAALNTGLPPLGKAATLGGDTSPAEGTTTPAQNYVGALDELEISRVARSPSFIQASFASQGQNSQMLAYGEDEENSGWSGGYFGVILRSVTIDGWVVISILGIMAVVSFTVMANKTRYINTISRANVAFLKLFEQSESNIEKLRSLLEASTTKGLKNSTLYRISEAGLSELARRSQKGQLRSLSPQAVATVRANLDRVSAYESQRLNSLMVLLTIAISGGPFLGLLGTVVGVMITFAAIAATGDVNINAIAPGIAAALVATVAGLGVAIPALFGYNYLITRIKDMTTEMHVFTDEFVTRLAESYPPSGGEALAAE